MVGENEEEEKNTAKISARSLVVQSVSQSLSEGATDKTVDVYERFASSQRGHVAVLSVLSRPTATTYVIPSRDTNEE